MFLRHSFGPGVLDFFVWCVQSVEVLRMANELNPDMVNHPDHYKFGGIETIDFIEAKELNYRLGNAVKYISRAGKKAGTDKLIEDLKKARWYLDREIKTLEG